MGYHLKEGRNPELENAELMVGTYASVTNPPERQIAPINGNQLGRV